METIEANNVFFIPFFRFGYTFLTEEDGKGTFPQFLGLSTNLTRISRE